MDANARIQTQTSEAEDNNDQHHKKDAYFQLLGKSLRRLRRCQKLLEIRRFEFRSAEQDLSSMRERIVSLMVNRMAVRCDDDNDCDKHHGVQSRKNDETTNVGSDTIADITYLQHSLQNHSIFLGPSQFPREK
jgi:hypothetical protein